MRSRQHVAVGLGFILLVIVGLGEKRIGVTIAQGVQPKADVPFASSAQIDASIAKTASSNAVTTRLLPDGAYQYFVAARKQRGSAELHTQFSDITIIRSGKGVLRTGHDITNRRETAPGEWRGDAIHGFVERTLGPGDLVVIPAGVAHQFVPVGNDVLGYVTVKVPAQRDSQR